MGSSLCLAIVRLKRKRPEIPEDVLIMILMRLPAKSLMRFKCVSKLWLSLISSRYFSNIFFEHSSSRQRFFAYTRQGWSEPALFTSTPTHDQFSSTFDENQSMPGVDGEFMNAVRGLACFQTNSDVLICNPNTRQLVRLPKGESERCTPKWSCLGYDPVHDEYKVLSLAWQISRDHKVVRSEHQVLVLEAGASWRKIQSHIYPHEAYSEGISINGVLYYHTKINHHARIVSFDLNSEEFNLIKLPHMRVPRTSQRGRINYKGKFARVVYLNDGMLNLWVLEDAKNSRWSDKKSFVLPLSQMNFGPGELELLTDSTSHTGSIWLKKEFPRQSPLFFNYDLEKSEITQRIQGHVNFRDSNWMFSVCWNGTESIMYLKT